jgi:hypothetical protein
MTGILDGMYVILSDIFYKRRNENKDEWIILSSELNINLLNFLYKRFTEDKDGLPKVEDLDLKKKQYYWGIALRFYTEKEDRIKAMRAAYALCLITSTD